MEPDSVIEDKTIELMVSAARWTVRSSVRPAPGGPAHLNVRREAGPGPPRCLGPNLGPPARRALLRIPRDLRPDLVRPPPCPSVFLPPSLLSCLWAHPSLERPSLACAVALAHTRSSISFLP